MASRYTETRAEYIQEWRIWYRMIYSCQTNAKYYVETDICDEWKGPEGFLEWLDYMGPRPKDRPVFDRINKLGDYEPGNVEWTTKQTSGNRRRDHMNPQKRAYWGKVARENGISKHAFFKRWHDYGWNLQDAATLPHMPGKPLNKRTT